MTPTSPASSLAAPQIEQTATINRKHVYLTRYNMVEERWDGTPRLLVMRVVVDGSDFGDDDDSAASLHSQQWRRRRQVMMWQNYNNDR